MGYERCPGFEDIAKEEKVKSWFSMIAKKEMRLMIICSTCDLWVWHQVKRSCGGLKLIIAKTSARNVFCLMVFRYVMHEDYVGDEKFVFFFGVEQQSASILLLLATIFLQMIEIF